MKTKLATFLAVFALGFTVVAQTTALTINSSTGLVIVPSGLTPNFVALRLNDVTLTGPASGNLAGTTDNQTLTHKTIALGDNTVTLTLPDTSAQSTGLFAYLSGQAVTPQQFGAVADGTSHPLSSRYGTLTAAQAVYPFVTALTQEIDWAATQAALDTGRKVYSPEGIYEIADPLTKRSIGQAWLGAGQNRTIYQQRTVDTNAVNIVNPAGDGNAAHQWRGSYNGGDGVYFQEIGAMNFEGQGDGGRAINMDGSGTHIGDWAWLHDLLIFRWHVGIYEDSYAHLRVSRCDIQNSTTLADAYGTGILLPTTSADPNSHIFEGVTLSGQSVGADIYGSGMKMNFGDVGLCTTGLQIVGSGTLEGGHFEGCATPIRVGAHSLIGTLTVSGVDMLVSDTASSPIVLDNGSIITGSLIGGAPNATTPLVLCSTELDQAYIVNLSNASDAGSSNPEGYQFKTSAGKTRRFPTFHQLFQNNRIPAASASFAGQFFIVINGAGISDPEDGRVIFCYEKADGSYAWSDLLNDGIFLGDHTWKGNQTIDAGYHLQLPASGGPLGGTLLFDSTSDWAASRKWWVRANTIAGGELEFMQSITDQTTSPTERRAYFDGNGQLVLLAGLSVQGGTVNGALPLATPASGGGILFKGITGNYDLSADWERYLIGDWSLNIGASGNGSPTKNLIYVDGVGNKTTIGHNAATQPGGTDTLNVEGTLGTTGHITVGGVLKLTPQAAPGSPQEGWVYADSTDHHLYFYNGTAWKQLDN